jgi:hypothetical protein
MVKHAARSTIKGHGRRSTPDQAQRKLQRIALSNGHLLRLTRQHLEHLGILPLTEDSASRETISSDLSA